MPEKDCIVKATSLVENPEISIIVPVFNMEQNGYLFDCLDSLIAQKGIPPYEILCIDDCSSDNSLEVLLNYAGEYPNITVIHMLQNSRQGAAKNRALDIAKGSYIGFVDGDDFVSDDYYQSLYTEAKQTDADLVEGIIDYVDENGNPMYPGTIHSPSESVTEWSASTINSFILSHPQYPACLFRRDMFENSDVRFEEHILYEDTPMLAWIISGIKKIAVTNKGRYYYRQYSSSTTKILNDKVLEDRMTSSRLILSNAKDAGVFHGQEEAWSKYYIQVALLNTLDMLSRDTSGSFRKKAAMIRNEVKTAMSDFGLKTNYKIYSLRERVHIFLGITFPRLYCRILSMVRHLYR